MRFSIFDPRYSSSKRIQTRPNQRKVHAEWHELLFDQIETYARCIDLLFESRKGHVKWYDPFFDLKNGHAKPIILLYESKNGYAKWHNLLFESKNGHAKWQERILGKCFREVFLRYLFQGVFFFVTKRKHSGFVVKIRSAKRKKSI